MQIFGRGLIRRLPPMLGGDPRRIRMVYSLLFSLPGTPVLFYGEEIGMGENLDAGDRLAVRTPMQWTSGRNAGSRPRRPSRLVAPVVDGAFGPEFVNVGDQRRDPDSLLNFMTLLIRRYRQSPELGWSEFEPSTSRTVRCSPIGVPGVTPAWSRCTTSARSRGRCRSHSPTATTRAGWSTCSRTDDAAGRERRRRHPARRLRLPLAAHHPTRRPPRPLTGLSSRRSRSPP